jgi:hypothetical protein
MKITREQIVGGVLVVLLLAVAGGYSVRSSSQTPERVFAGMLTQNLSTNGVTRVITQNSEELNVAQYTQLSFGAQPNTHAITVFKQPGGVIVTEQISNRSSDVVRYQRIETSQKNAAGKPIDVSKVVGKWAKLTEGTAFNNSVSSGLFDQSLLGVVPIANLNPATRNELLQTIQDDEVFAYELDKVQTKTRDGRKVYEYPVTIKPAAYVAMMQQFGKLVGATQYDELDPATYANAAALQATFVVDVASRQLREVTQSSGGRTEEYRAFGVAQNLAVPRTTLTAAELAASVAALR